MTHRRQEGLENVFPPVVLGIVHGFILFYFFGYLYMLNQFVAKLAVPYISAAVATITVCLCSFWLWQFNS